MDFPPVCGASSEEAGEVVCAELDGPGSGKIKGIVVRGGREDWPGAMGNVIGYSEPGSASGEVSWVSGGVGNSSRYVDMGFGWVAWERCPRQRGQSRRLVGT